MKHCIVLFDKFYNGQNGRNSDTTHQFADDKFYPINRLVLKKLSEINVNTRIIIVPIESNKTNRLSKKYSDLITNFKIDILPIEPVYSELRDKGIDPFYWKATNKSGHWNHIAHDFIGRYLADSISAKL